MPPIVRVSLNTIIFSMTRQSDLPSCQEMCMRMAGDSFDTIKYIYIIDLYH